MLAPSSGVLRGSGVRRCTPLKTRAQPRRGVSVASVASRAREAAEELLRAADEDAASRAVAAACVAAASAARTVSSTWSLSYDAAAWWASGEQSDVLSSEALATHRDALLRLEQPPPAAFAAALAALDPDTLQALYSPHVAQLRQQARAQVERVTEESARQSNVNIAATAVAAEASARARAQLLALLAQQREDEAALSWQLWAGVPSRAAPSPAETSTGSDGSPFAAAVTRAAKGLLTASAPTAPGLRDALAQMVERSVSTDTLVEAFRDQVRDCLDAASLFDPFQFVAQPSSDAFAQMVEAAAPGSTLDGATVAPRSANP